MYYYQFEYKIDEETFDDKVNNVLRQKVEDQENLKGQCLFKLNLGEDSCGEQFHRGIQTQGYIKQY